MTGNRIYRSNHDHATFTIICGKQGYLYFVLIALLLIGAPVTVRADPYSVLYSFAGGTDGGVPSGCSLIHSGSTLYGLTNAGGEFGYGTAFSYDVVSGAHTVLHSFDQPNGQPSGSLIQSGSILYGTTPLGGDNDDGTLFSYNLATNGYNILYSFDSSSGAWPVSSLRQSGSILYGTTSRGGPSPLSYGTIFSFEPNTNTHAVLYTFDSLAKGQPNGTLSQSGSVLYGFTYNGGGPPSGPQYYGTIFSYDLTTNTQTTLFSFMNADHFQPVGGPVLSGSTLYGMTIDWANGGAGSIFSYNLLTNTYTSLHTFTDADGFRPEGSLILAGTTLYGMTSLGGTYNTGAIFSFDTLTQAYTNLHSFNVSNDGGYPYGDLLLIDHTLYGLTTIGGEHYEGTIFSYTIPEPASLSVFALLATSMLGCPLARRHRSR